MVVTGGGSGIGHAIATGALARGASVAVLDLDPATAPSGARPFAADVTDDESVARAVSDAAGELGGIDALVNNAGIGAQGTVETNPIDEWRRVLDVNLLGMVRATRAALAHLRRSDRAAVVNMCSIAATAGLPERALYSASKGAVLSLTLAMAADHLHEGIRVNCVNPGTTDTPWIGRLLDQSRGPRRRAGRARGPPAIRSVGAARGGRRRRPVPAVAVGRSDHRHRPRRGRWHGRSPAATSLTIRTHHARRLRPLAVPRPAG